MLICEDIYFARRIFIFLRLSLLFICFGLYFVLFGSFYGDARSLFSVSRVRNTQN